MVFGRGGEEALALAEAGIPFRIVPGITAGIGGLAYAGIPLTHRGINSAVTLVTGHDGGDTPDTRDWAAIAHGAPVLVLYMGLRHLGTIAARLIAAGRDPDEPVAIVSKATTKAQRVLATTLLAAGADVAAHRVETPAIIVIGRVVELGAVLDWFAPG
jgi:uroporphyrin-III C-methyltransferase